MRSFCILLTLALLNLVATAQRVAILQPDSASAVDRFAGEVRSRLSNDFKLLDDSLVESAYRSVPADDPFNLSTAEARRIGSVIGAENFVLLRSRVQRRAALAGSAYFEAYAISYVVSSRTGSLLDWHVESVEAPDEDEARKRLIERVPILSDRIGKALKANHFSIVRDPKFLEVPAENSPLAKDLRTPVPYRRLRPEYTGLASSYGVKATVDIEVDVDADGTIARTSIERWAGFGLEDSVEKTVRSMNWRPAEREGRPLPMRILLRYNFTKIEKDEAP